TESRAPGDPAPERSEVLVQPGPGSDPEEGPVLDPEEGPVLEPVRIYTDTDPDLPEFPQDFQVAKYCFYEQGGSWVLLELQSAGCGRGRCYRVVCWGPEQTRLVLASSSEEALDSFRDLGRALEASGLRRRSGAPPEAPGLGSIPLQQLLLEERVAVGGLSPEVWVLVELLWAEALGLGSVLRVPFSRLSLNDVGRAEGLLLQARRKLLQEELQEAQSLLEEVYVLLPHREAPPPTATLQLLSQKLDLCQLVRDVLGVSESAPGGPAPSSLGRYRALRCSMEALPPQSNQFQAVARLLQPRVRVLRVVRVCRGVELQTFRGELGNVRPLLHASSPSNLVGILSRGLLPPHRGLELHGVQRTDQGDLGSGIYFGDSVRTCLRFSRPGSDGSRFLLVCDVALGRGWDLRQRDPALTRPPPGSPQRQGGGPGPGGGPPTDDEFVVYSADQVQIRYLVQFLADGDQLKDLSPETTVQTPPSQELQPENEALEEGGNPLEEEEGALGGGSPLEGGGDPLGGRGGGTPGRIRPAAPPAGGAGEGADPGPFRRVVLFQTYSNPSPAHIEAKYVFPLEEGAAVCGFEAFINGKHLVGQVKEKEAARREYRQAVARGDGAYLLDQDAPDVFSLSVGNLPPGASVLIKLAFLSELVVSGGAVRFFLPGRVAPWQQDAGLNQTTQVSVQKMCVSAEEAETREFRLEASVEMPQEILSLDCSHRVQIKRTACRAVVRLFPGQVLEAGGFHLSVFLPEAQQPRMWVEQHPERDSQACMLVFYPDLAPGPGSGPGEVVLLLDCSESMRAWLDPARTLALQLLRRLDPALRVNVLLFGSDHSQAFLRAQPLATSRQDAERFIRRAPPGGSTELWRPLRALGLLPPALGLRNLLLLSDGHVQNAAATLTLLRGHAHHTRLFTCGLSPTANRHMLRALAQAGGGAYEFFDTKTKHNWPEKVRWQVRRMAAPGCSSVSVSWQQFGSSAPEPIQAPKQLTLFSHQHTLVYGLIPHCTQPEPIQAPKQLTLFSHQHTLVYGLIPRCTQATLLGQFCGQELSCTVSTTDLQTTTGTFLHRLTARALIRDYEDGNLETTEAEHEGRKAELKAFIIRLSKEFSLLSQFTSFVAVEERDSEDSGFTDVPQLIAQEDVDFLPYMGWTPETHPPEASSQDDDFSQVLDYNPDEEDLRSSEGRRSPERIFCDVLQDEDDPGILQGLTLVRGNSRSGSSVGDDEDSDEDSDEWDEEPETYWSASVRAHRSAPPPAPPLPS
ncbi:LOW QUALITY PROTEIN: protein mono-ADP-ribosyltransferase PARP4-like, partial [Menidia menidia]